MKGSLYLWLLLCTLTIINATKIANHNTQNSYHKTNNYYDPQRHITVGSVRFSILTDAVIRVETGSTVEDRPSITFPYRYSQPVPPYKVVGSNPLIVQTSRVTLSYDPAGNGSLKCRYFNVSYMLAGKSVTACVGEGNSRVPTDPDYPGVVMDEWTEIIKSPPGNLNGSLSTTDCYVGSDLCYNVLNSRIQPGLVSREGWTVVDDSNTSLWDTDITWQWRIPRTSVNSDLYIFAHGHDYKGALGDFVKLAGSYPMKPWRTFGVWTSREFSYTDNDMKSLTQLYEKYQLPLNMIVLDYAWHYGPANASDVQGCNQPLIAGGTCQGGYGGYVWDKNLFPNPMEFQEWAHFNGFELCLNIHDQCGIDMCQLHYTAAAVMNGIDPSTKTPVACNLLQKSYALAQSVLMLENEENINVDYWWNDYGVGGPQAGGYQLQCDPNDSANSTYPNGPPSFGHCMHCYLDLLREKPVLWNSYVRVSRKEIRDERGLSLGIYGGLGHHRYPTVGSGDVFEDWKTLAFEVYLTMTGSNVGIEWSHDLGGFMPGPFSSQNEDGTWTHNPEIYLRWLQAGVFQPIFRTHICTGGDASPWIYPNFDLLQQTFQFRNTIVPYLYTASFRSYQTGVLPVHPIYYEWPEYEEAYTVSKLVGPNNTLEYYFGQDFIVAPITAFSDKNSHLTSWITWVPPGNWVDWWDGSVLTGPTWRTKNYRQSEIPLMVRPFSVIPMKTLTSRKDLLPDPLVLTVIWGGTGVGLGTGELYEDNGRDLQYQYGNYYVHRSQFSVGKNSAQLSFSPCAEGNGFSGIPTNRSYFVRFRNAPQTAQNVGCTQCSSFTWFWENDNGIPVLVASTLGMAYNASFDITLNY